VADDHKRLTALLVGDLAELRAAAGGPSLVRIEKESGRLAGTTVFGVRVTRLPRSTVHDLLRRVRSRPLRAELVESLWAVLRHLVASQGRGPAALDTLDELRRRLELINVAWHLRELTEIAGPRVGTRTVGTRTVGTRTVGVGSVGVGSGGGSGTGGAMGSPGRTVFDPFGCPPPDGDEESARRWLLDSAAATRAHSWWNGGRHVVPGWLADYLTLERRADTVRAYAPWFVPGILQTEEYAWAAFRRDRPGAGAAELAGLVHVRMRRQEPLWWPDAMRFWVVIDEVALRARICGRAAMRGQLEHLLKVCAMPNITVQVMRRDAPGHGAADGPVALLRFPEHALPDVVFVEQKNYGLYPTGREDAGHYRQLLTRLAIEALTPDESADLIRELRYSHDQ
jgi:hypothetical protein